MSKPEKLAPVAFLVSVHH